ncbi:hypothetical protein Bca4012_031910 [Brassica carinata]|uniref:Uncharacterized protein n=1 Tax=Brassica cretica TaxID=69181 RepID=A0ABQ7DET8_BRACR|nr:hypothetical protein DY000_02032898 [Brassica cretica]
MISPSSSSSLEDSTSEESGSTPNEASLSVPRGLVMAFWRGRSLLHSPVAKSDLVPSFEVVSCSAFA